MDIEILCQITLAHQEGQKKPPLLVVHPSDNHLILLGLIEPEGFPVAHPLVLGWRRVFPPHEARLLKVDLPLGDSSLVEHLIGRFLREICRHAPDFLVSLLNGSDHLRGCQGQTVANGHDKKQHDEEHPAF